MNVADGDVAPGSKDAVNGGQLHQAMTDTRNAVKDDIDNMRSSPKNDIDTATSKVGAQAAAMANLHPLGFLSQQNDTLLKENSEIKADNKKLSEKLEKNTEELSTLKQAYLKLAEQIKSLLPSRN